MVTFASFGAGIDVCIYETFFQSYAKQTLVTVSVMIVRKISI